MEDFSPVVCAIDIGGTKFEVGLVTRDTHLPLFEGAPCLG